MIPSEIERLLPKVQKPARYCGGEINTIIKDKSNPLIMHCRGSVGKLKAIFEKSKYLFPFEYKSIKIIFIRSRIRKETKLWQRSINIGDLLQ